MAGNLSVLVAILIIPFYQTADWLFAIFDHPFEVQRLELIYFRILLYGAPFMVIANAISSFFSGLGKTWTVMWVNFLGTGVNLFLDYLLIFGNWGFPELGMEGAGWATSAAAVVIALTFFVLMAKPKYNRVYHTLKGWQFDRPLFRRLVR
ncbi:MAG: MATE family efflux transporter, partial [Phycisphaerae bacterium]|nr:MATE family efflux transporter [Phycisphaerae bacterium]